MKLHANVCSQWEWTKLRQLLVIVLLGLGIVSTYGQTKTVSGIVKSESGGEPLVGATVKVKETNTGGITDIDGRYTIQAKSGTNIDSLLHRLPHQRGESRAHHPHRHTAARRQ